MVEAWTERPPSYVYFLNILYWLLPSILFHFGIITGFPVEMVLFIHWIIMLLIPKLIVRQFKDSYLFRLEWQINRFEGAGSILGIILGIIFWGFIIFLYWLIDRVIHWDLHDYIMRAPIPQNKYLEILSAIYLVIIAPYIEEWFWRRYNYHMFYKRELDYLLVSILWTLPFIVVAIDWHVKWQGLIFIGAFFILFGRIQIMITSQYHPFACYMSHVGVYLGIMIWYFLEKNDKFSVKK